MLISAQALNTLKDQQNARILLSKLQPVGISFPTQEHSGFIPGSTPFDVALFSDTSCSYPHTLLSPKAFQERAQALGINNDSAIVVYDEFGIYSAPRVWFNFRVMGFSDIAVLNGGLPSWQTANLAMCPVQTNSEAKGNFEAAYQQNLAAAKEDVLAAIDSPRVRIIDLRSSERFKGLQQEPRKGLRAGHIPSSINIPFPRFIENGQYRSIEALTALFDEFDCNKDQTLIFSCGSGITACIGFLAASICGFPNIKVYDGSWAEWGASDLPIQI